MFTQFALFGLQCFRVDFSAPRWAPYI